MKTNFFRPNLYTWIFFGLLVVVSLIGWLRVAVAFSDELAEIPWYYGWVDYWPVILAVPFWLLYAYLFDAIALLELKGSLSMYLLIGIYLLILFLISQGLAIVAKASIFRGSHS